VFYAKLDEKYLSGNIAGSYFSTRFEGKQKMHLLKFRNQEYKVIKMPSQN
jgi:hypothetical protein